MQQLNIQNSKICVGESYLNLPKYLPEGQVVLVTDKDVYANYKSFIDSYKHIVIGTGEGIKNWQTVEEIIEQLLDFGADRGTFLVGFGGGLVTDVTGFVASVFMRGIRFGFVATTLLAQVDASLGGKNGINFHSYKNMVGIFRVPEFVICDTVFFKTLPNRELRSGFGEIIKHALIRDAALFTDLQNNVSDLLGLKADILEDVILRAIKVKADVVANDWQEKGERKHLNFGHTLGHAIENNTDFAHGEAVAVGMYWAAKWSQQRGRLPEGEVAAIKDLLEQFGLPISHTVPNEQCVSFMQKDKKKQGTRLDFVFLERVGHAYLEMVSLEEMAEALEI